MAVAQGGKILGLRKRLAADTLTPEDKDKLALARDLRALRAKGLNRSELAVRLKMSERAVESFGESATFILLPRNLAALDRGADAETADRIVRKAKQEFAGFAGDAIDYFRSCYERNHPEDQPEKGIFKDDAKAMWATEKVAKG